MLKKTLFILFSLFLVGCGGSDTNEELNTNGSSPAPAITSPADTITPVLTDLMTTLLFVAPELNIEKDIYLESYQTGWLPCQNVPIQQLIETQTRVRKLNLNDCKFNGMRLSGELQVEDSFDKLLKTEYKITFKNAVLQNGSKKFMITGTTQISALTGLSADSCSAKVTVTHNLNFVAPNATVNFKDFILKIDGPSPNFCPSSGVSISGTIAHSKTGTYNFLTDATIPMYYESSFKQRSAKLRLVANSESLHLTKSVTYSGVNLALSVIDNTNRIVSNLNLPISLSIPLIISDLSDSDQDGLPNGYESAIGLNPNDKTDAEADQDKDSFSNLFEFKNGANPIVAASKPLVVRIGFSSDRPSLIYGDNSSFTVPVIARLYYISNIEVPVQIKATLTGDMFFQPQQDCILSNSNKTSTCSVNLLNTEIFGFEYRVAVDPHNYGTIEANIKAELTTALNDITPDDNIYLAKIIRQNLNFTPLFNHKVIYQNNQSSDSNTFNIVKGQATEYYLNADYQNRVPEFGIIVPELPDGVEIIKTECLPSKASSTWQPCPMMEYQISKKFRLTLNASKTGIYRLNFQVFREKGAINPDFVYENRVVVGDSTEGLQALIDNAQSETTLDVMNGIYIGKLNLSQKKIRLKSSGKSYLLNLISAEHYSDDIAVRNTLQIGQGSSIDGFTISAHHIILENGGGSIINSKLGESENDLIHNIIEIKDNLNFQNNEVKNHPEGYSLVKFYSPMLCPRFIFSNNENNEHSYALFANNKFIATNLGCQENLITIKKPLKIDFIHNTVMRFITVIEPPSWNEISKIDVTVENNLFFNSIPNFSHFDDYIKSHLSSRASFNYNMFWGYELSNHGEFLKYVELRNNLNADPLLDPNFDLTKNSPAIDSASDIVLLQHFQMLRLFEDGNGDGVVKPDIGANEYRPKL